MFRALLLACLMFVTRAHAEALPVFNPSGPNAEAYGIAEGYPTGYPQTQRTLVGNFSRLDRIARTHRVARASVAAPFDRAPSEIALTYMYQRNPHSIADYLSRHPATGLLILKDNTILAEHYQYGRTEQDRLLSQSMAKTITSMLIGIAVSEGRIHSIDEPAAATIRDLEGSEIGATPIRALLHMSAGIAFREVYDGHDDSAALQRGLRQRNSPGTAAVLRQFNTREVPPDTKWHYSGQDTVTLGLLLSTAVGESQADYLSERIWSRIGTESDAFWEIDQHGQEIAACCFVATLRDWGRFGRLLAHDGAWNGQQIIPRQWVIDATTPQADFLRPGAGAGYYGYGYQVWLLPGSRREFVLLGIHGQQIFVDPPSKLVLVHTAVRPTPTGDTMQPELGALWRALVAQEGR